MRNNDCPGMVIDHDRTDRTDGLVLKTHPTAEY